MDEWHPALQEAAPPWEEDPRRTNAGRTALSIVLILAVLVCAYLAKFGTYPLHRELYERFAWGDTHEDLEAMGMQALSDGGGTGITLMGVPVRAYMIASGPNASPDFLGLNGAVYYYAVGPSAGVKGLMIYTMGLDEKDCRNIAARLSLHYGLIPDLKGDSPASPYGMAARLCASGLCEEMGELRGKTWYKDDRRVDLTTFLQPYGSGADRYSLELIITPRSDGEAAAAEGAAEATAAPPAVTPAAAPDPRAEAALREALAVLAPYYSENADFTIWLAGEYAEAGTMPGDNSDAVFQTKDRGKRVFIETGDAKGIDYSAETDAAIDRNVIRPILNWEKQFEHTDLGHGVYRTENITWARLKYELRGGTGVLHYRSGNGVHSVDLRFFKEDGPFTEAEELLCDWIAASYSPGRSDTPPLE